MDLADLSTNPLCSLPFTNFTNPPSTSSVWIHIVLPLRSWPILLNPHHPHQTPSLSPGITNVVVIQSQVRQGRVVLQSLCQCLTGDKDLQNTLWNHLSFYEIHTKEISMPSTAFFSYFRSYSHIMWSPMKWERTSSNALRSAWWTWQISAPILCVVFLSLISPIHHQLALSGSILSYLSAHDRFCSILTILTKHQAWAPAAPMLLWFKARFVRVELCFRPSARALPHTKICKIRREII